MSAAPELGVLGLDESTAAAYSVAVGRLTWGRDELVDEIARGTTSTATDAAACVDRLFRSDLLRDAEAESGTVRVVPPSLALRTRLARERSELADRQRRVEDADAALADLQERWSETKDCSTAEVIEHVTGLDAVHGRLEQLAAGTRREALSLLPANALTPESIESSRALDVETLGRGVAVRTIATESALRGQASGAYLRWLCEAGAEVRTVAALPLRLVVSDRVAAILPIDAEDPRAGALVVRAPGLLTALISLFETVWRSATPLDAPREEDPIGLDEVDNSILEILATGATDQTVSRQLGVSVRSVRRMMSGLMTRFAAGSRFELGVRLGSRGWTSQGLQVPPSTDD